MIYCCLVFESVRNKEEYLFCPIIIKTEEISLIDLPQSLSRFLRLNFFQMINFCFSSELARKK